MAGAGRSGRAFGRTKAVAGVLGAAAGLVPLQLLHNALAPATPPRVARLFHRAFARSLGIRVHRRGAPAEEGATLFISNHVSWADIPVLGSQLLGNFVAKHEIGGWGVFGLMADLQRTIYVERDRRQAAGDQRGAIFERLAAGGNVILFPEGTSSDGVRVLPFKSSLFSVVEGEGAERFRVQPVTVAYTRLDGLPITLRRLPDIAWIGDTDMVPHALEFVRLGRVQADVLVHAPVRPADFRDRKALARHCHAVVSHGYHALMRGRFDAAAPAIISDASQS